MPNMGSTQREAAEARSFWNMACAHRNGFLSSQDGSYKEYMRARCCCEWTMAGNRHRLVEFILIMFYFLYINLYVTRTLAFYRHRQIVDYIPQAWCTAIAKSEARPADWKVDDTCVDHATSLANQGALFDIVQQTFPNTDGSITHMMPEVMQGMIVAIVASVCIWGSIFSMPGLNYQKPFLVSMTVRTLRVLVLVTFLRPMFYLSTSLPGPALKCVGVAEEVFRPKNIMDIWTDFSLSEHNCGDLLYSGHMSSVSVMVCIFLHYGRPLLDPFAKVYEVIRIVLLVLLMCQGWMVVVVRNHYTVDVVGAIMMSFACWRLGSHELEELHPSHLLDGYMERSMEEKEDLSALSAEAYAPRIDYAGVWQGGITLVSIVVIFTSSIFAIFSAMLGH